MRKTAVIIVNTGTPDSPAVGDVRRYLRQFLGDARVISMPWLLRKLLVNGIIAPIRGPKSAKLYQKVWTEKGSPLLFHGQSVADKLQDLLGNEYQVMLAMRYGNPSLRYALNEVVEKQFQRLILIPLFPQYASSTSGSIISFALNHLKKYTVIPALEVRGQFYDHPGYLESFAEQIIRMNPHGYDHILFSYHSLPISHVNATHQEKDCSHFGCTHKVTHENAFCYRATCYATSRLLAQKVNISPENYTVCFQSRFSKNWIGPFSDKVIREKARQGVKKILVVSPAFVADCLETIVEIGHEYREIFLKNGGENFEWIESLNDHDTWIRTLAQIIQQ
jgi:protoporphyrin/coproporphyrin ferrochelatase